MKITDTVERECCDFALDLLPFRGLQTAAILRANRLRFCRHCGQIWMWTRPPGDHDWGWERMAIKELG